MIKPYVYKWTDLSNGRMYIGSHNGSNPNYKGSGKLFKLAYNKRPDMFVRDILFEGDYSDVLELEEFMLTELNAADNEAYYNLKNSALGGTTPTYERTEKHREFLSEIKKGNEYGKGVKHDHKGEKNPYYGVRKKVYCDWNGKTYNDRQSAAKDLGYANKAYIGRMIAGERKNKYGLRYID